MLSDAHFKFVQNIVFPFAFTVGSELSQTLPESQAGTCYVTESVALINCRSFPIIITDIPDSIINWHCFHCFNRRHKHLYLHITQRWFSKILLDFIAVASKVHGCLMPSIPIVVSSTHLIASLYIFLARYPPWTMSWRAEVNASLGSERYYAWQANRLDGKIREVIRPAFQFGKNQNKILQDNLMRSI